MQQEAHQETFQTICLTQIWILAPNGPFSEIQSHIVEFYPTPYTWSMTNTNAVAS